MNYLGIDIGGTKIKTVVLNEKGDVLERNEVLTEDGSGEAELWKNKIIAQIKEKTQQYADGDKNASFEGWHFGSDKQHFDSDDQHSDSGQLRCAISAPGLVDSENRMTLNMPERLQGIENFNWSKELGMPIRALNDGHSACLAEYESFYRPQGIRHMLMLTLGTGVGGGIIIDGRLYQGNLQRAGHVGHMTVQFDGPPTMTNMPGSLEHAVGNFSVSERTEGRFDSVRALVYAYENGDAQAEDWWLLSVRKLAVALASLTNILSPELIVLGGGISAGAGDSLLNPLKEFMAECEWRPGGNRVRIEKAKLGGYAGAIGAAYFARKRHRPLAP